VRFILYQKIKNTQAALRLGLNAGWVKVRHYNTRKGADRAAMTLAKRSKQFAYKVVES
jgi:hypothetical protein